MLFDEVLDYLELMVGEELPSLNPSTEPTVILKVDRATKRYQLAATSSIKSASRSFNHLEMICSELSKNGFVNIEQALGGAGSSRHQLETIIANLPNVEHFKYDKKKHLYLRDSDTHPLGTIKALSSSESRNIKSRIDNYRDFDIAQFHTSHNQKITLLKNKLNNVFTKYPGESDVEDIGQLLIDLTELGGRLSGAIVNIDMSHSEPSNDDDSITNLSDDGDNDDDDDDEHTLNAAETQGLQPTRISQVSPTISLLYDRVLHDEIDLQPEFQRKDRIWPKKDKARLIESILLGLPLPVFYFAERPNPNPKADLDFDWVIIDGLQRITSLIDFMKGLFPLTDLTMLGKFDTCYFKDLPRREQRKIREYQIHGHLIQISKDSDEMIRELFHRINTYGKNLSYQEIRSALYPGSANRFMKYIAESDQFIDAIPAKINPERMLDIEYVLRAVSFIILGYEKYTYAKNDDFLCRTLKVLNKYTYVANNTSINSDEIYDDLEYRINSAFITINKIFGRDSYKKGPEGKINKILFELMVSIFALMNDQQRTIASTPNNADAIKCRLFEMITDDIDSESDWISETYKEQDRGFNYAISNSTSKRVTILFRFRSIINMINDITKMDFLPKPLLEDQNVKEGDKL